MANRAQRLSTNIAGDFFVDNTCIDCDQCREIAPEVFGDGEGHASVLNQPDITDHAKFHKYFGCQRIMHERDVCAATAGMEWKLAGDAPQSLGPDLMAIPTPGHTRGHTVLLYRDQYLFSGDHLWWSPVRKQLSASRAYCWYSWPKQVESMERLLEYRFEWVLPGHGHRHYFPSVQMHDSLTACVQWMKQVR